MQKSFFDDEQYCPLIAQIYTDELLKSTDFFQSSVHLPPKKKYLHTLRGIPKYFTEINLFPNQRNVEYISKPSIMEISRYEISIFIVKFSTDCTDLHR